jgi:hypothetical protein
LGLALQRVAVEGVSDKSEGCRKRGEREEVNWEGHESLIVFWNFFPSLPGFHKVVIDSLGSRE